MRVNICIKLKKGVIMAWDRKLMRTVRVRNSQKMGVLAKLLTAVAEAGGSVEVSNS